MWEATKSHPRPERVIDGENGVLGLIGQASPPLPISQHSRSCPFTALPC